MIMDCALELFSKKGFHEVSMQEIAEESEFSVGTLYNFFENKDALFDELLSSFGEKILAILLDILEGQGSEVTRIRRLIRAHVLILEEHAIFIKLYVSELGHRCAKLSTHQTKKHLKKTSRQKLLKVIELAVEKGEIRRVDPEITAMALFSALETLAFESAGHFDKAEVTARVHKVEQLFLDGLLLPKEQHK